MCLTASALALFLNSISVPVTNEPGRITVHASNGAVHWQAYADEWCIASGTIKAELSTD